jgi:hypothetical protein
MKRTPRSRSDATVAHHIAQPVRRAVFDALLHAADEGLQDDGALTVEPADEPMAPALLAAQHPEAVRPAMCELYERCLQHYRGIVGDGPDDTDDVRAVVVHFVAANMQALLRIRVTPAMLLSLERQLAGVARLQSGWDRVGLRERQLFFEKMAILSVLIDQTWTRAMSQGRAIAHVQRTARGYLKELFGFEPERLTLSDSGLRIAPVAVAA